MRPKLQFAQAFGERGVDGGVGIQDVDLISAVQFSDTGDMVATGDKGGRVVLLRAVEDNADPKQVEFRFWTQFQSHEPEFDYLKSMEIEERINRICWLDQTGGARRILTTNDKTIKLFKVDERNVTRVQTMDHFQGRNGISNTAVPARSSPTKLTIPRIQGREAIISSNCTRSFANAHTYHINSVSVSSDEETFLSADDLRVNLWHLEKGESGFNVLDLKPENMEDLSEVITCAQFHPEHCNLFAISTSRAVVKLNDLRASALCDGSAKEFTVPDDVSRNQSFFSEIVASISDLKFSRDGKYFCTRDYETLRVWDMRKETEPLKIIPVFEQINSRLVELYENECIFDRFQCAFSNDGSSVVTGSYNGLFCSFSLEQGDDLAVEASVDFVSGANRKHLLSAPDLVNASILDSSMGELVEPVKRIMHVDASPTEKVYAVAAGPSLYIFHS